MRAKKWANHVRCVNCGSFVHWTAFQCDFCGGNPREKEPMVEIQMSEHNLPQQTLERRRFPRYEVQGKVVLNRFYKGELIDLCEAGAKLKTVLRLFRDEMVHLDFAVNGIPIRVKARVVHVKRGVLEDTFTLGVSFEAIARDHSEILSHHLKAISEQKPRSEAYA
jgi:hypothetical protein